MVSIMFGEYSGRFYVAVLFMIVAGGLVGFTASYIVLMGRIDALESQLKIEIERNSESIGEVEKNLAKKVNELSRYITDVRNDLTRSAERNRNDIIAVKMDLVENVENLSDEIAAVKTDLSNITIKINTLETYLETLSSDVKSLEERFAEIESELNFTNFQTLKELKDWLEADTTNQQRYIPNEHDCEDFAFDLMINAFKSRRIIGTIAVYLSDTLLYIERSDGTYYQVPIAYDVSPYHIFGDHMMNIAYVETRGWVLIEPQTDLVIPLDTYEL